jgi:DNA-binding HxlR family transcriptional regulator
MIWPKRDQRWSENFDLTADLTKYKMKKKSACSYPYPEITHVEQTLLAIGGKWKLLIILSLRRGNKHFSDIAKSLSPITFRMLSKELKELERNGLANRKIAEGPPARIVYELTPLADTLNSLLDQMASWGESLATNRDFVATDAE